MADLFVSRGNGFHFGSHQVFVDAQFASADSVAAANLSAAGQGVVSPDPSHDL